MFALYTFRQALASALESLKAEADDISDRYGEAVPEEEGAPE